MVHLNCIRTVFKLPYIFNFQILYYLIIWCDIDTVSLDFLKGIIIYFYLCYIEIHFALNSKMWSVTVYNTMEWTFHPRLKLIFTIDLTENEKIRLYSLVGIPELSINYFFSVPPPRLYWKNTQIFTVISHKWTICCVKGRSYQFLVRMLPCLLTTILSL